MADAPNLDMSDEVSLLPNFLIRTRGGVPSVLVESESNGVEECISRGEDPSLWSRPKLNTHSLSHYPLQAVMGIGNSEYGVLIACRLPIARTRSHERGSANDR